MSRVVVTGATGFVGSALVQRLVQDGHDVVGIARRRPAAAPANGQLVVGDIARAGELSGRIGRADVVFHLAGLGQVDPRIGETAYWTANVEGTCALLDAAKTWGASSLVYLSSTKAQAETTEDWEDDSFPSRPTSAYGRSKLAAEEAILSHGAATGTHVVCLRPPLIYGTGVKGNLARLIDWVAAGRVPPLPAGLGQRSLVHLERVVEALRRAAFEPATNGQRLLVTDRRPYSAREIQDLIWRALGRRPPGWSVPRGVLWSAAALGSVTNRLVGDRVPLDLRRMGQMFGHAVFDGARAASLLGLTAGQDLAQVMPDMVLGRRRAA